jgi:sigma-B regulation protein RsbU (phosphoserine phosphatase)
VVGVLHVGSLPLLTDPPIGVAEDPSRRSVTSVVPLGALLCFFTDGLVERRGQVIDLGLNRVAATLDKQIAAGPGDPAGLAAEDACTEVMRALVGNASSPDDITVLMFSRRSAG